MWPSFGTKPLGDGTARFAADLERLKQEESTTKKAKALTKIALAKPLLDGSRVETVNQYQHHERRDTRAA